MDTLLSIQVFSQIVESGTLAAAAERLSLSRAMTTKHLKNLESRLGARLLNRTSHHLSLTEPGRLYFERCKVVLSELEEAASAVDNVNGTPTGTIRVTCPSWLLASRRLANLLAAYGRQYPGVLVDLSLEDRVVDLVAEGYDLAIRCTADTPPEGLVVRRLRPMPFVIAGSPEYLERRGVPKSIEQLSDHDSVMVGNGSIWEFQGSKGTLRIPARVVLRFQSATLAAAHAAVVGVGLAALPLVLLEEPMFKGRLRPVLVERPLRQPDMYAMYRYVSPKIRTFIDHTVEFLAAMPIANLPRAA